MEFMAMKDYEQASIQFAELGDYKDSVKLYNQCQYKIGEERYIAKDYSGAIEILSDISDYSESVSLLAEVKYDYGKKMMNEKDYQAAAEYLKGLNLNDSNELYEKSVALSGSYTYNHKFYLMPDQIKGLLEADLLTAGGSWQISDPVASGDSDTVYLYILDEEGTVLNAYVSLFNYNKDEGTIGSLAFSYDTDKVQGDQLSLVISAVLKASDPSLDTETAEVILSDLQESKSSQDVVAKLENNGIEYVYSKDLKSVVVLMTPLTK